MITYPCLLQCHGIFEHEASSSLYERLIPADRLVLMVEIAQAFLRGLNRREHPWLPIPVAVHTLAEIDLARVLVRDVTLCNIEDGVRWDEV